MNEPDWIEHDGSAVCPVPAGHDVEVRFRDGSASRDCTPEDWCWLDEGRPFDITHYRDWTAFEQQQASAEVPEMVPVPIVVVRFLKGEGLLDGLSFGEARGYAYWWRKYLPALPTPVDPLRTALDEAGAECGFHISEDFVAACRARGVTLETGRGEG